MSGFSVEEEREVAFHDVQTLPTLFAWRVRQTPEAPAYLQFDASADAWRPVSWKSTAVRVDRIAAALSSMNLPHGARIAILLPNGFDAVCVDLGALALGHVPVPMHALDNPGSIAYILMDSGASVLVAQSMAQWNAIVSTGMAFPDLRQVIVVDPGASESAMWPGGVCAFDGWIDSGDRPPPARQRPVPGDLAALVYTSGTTGKPKGVMLTHRNVIENVKATLVRVAPRPDDIFLSFLPLSHTFERTAGYYVPMAAGSCVAHARSVALLAEDLIRVRPTILVSVPRIYERMLAAITNRLSKAPLKSRLFRAAQAVGWRRFCRRQHLPVFGRVPPWLDALLWPLLDRLVARHVRALFGGRLRAAVSGGAALALPVARYFLGLGVPILQGYGMTETSPVVAANAPEDNDPRTVGRPLAGVEVRIGEDKELEVRGPSVMRGYWKREADTLASFAGGWLRSGDQADIVDGRIRILGRLKEIIVTSTGEKIAPADLEQAIVGDPLFEQAWVFGDDRPFIACAVVLNQSQWSGMAASLGLDPAAEPKLHDAGVVRAVLERIDKLTKAFPHYGQPRAVIVSLVPWTPENSLLTPTLKLKRLNLASHFAQDIERIYRRQA